MAGHKDVITNFYRLRQALGYLGLFLPLLLWLLGLIALGEVEPSFSDYYHTVLRDLFITILFAIGVFLICYTGYAPDATERVSDRAITTLAGIGAIGVAYFPNKPTERAPLGPQTLSQIMLEPQVTPVLHYGCAVIFLVLLGYMSLVKFARTSDLKRRRIYVVCGWTVFAATTGVIASSLMKQSEGTAMQAFANRFDLVFWFEAIAVWAFSLSWLVKGRADASVLQGLRSLIKG